MELQFDANKKTHQEHQEIRRAAARGDMDAAARLLVAKFSQLCREVIDWNKKTHQEHQETRRAAARGDMDAAARLLDF